MARTPKDPDAVKRGRSARVKGAAAEREVCAILADITGRDYRRILGQARDSGADVEYGPFLLEIKRQERLKMVQFQEQARESAALAGKMPAVVYRQNKQDWWISLPFADFVTLLEALHHGRDRSQHAGVQSDAGDNPAVDAGISPA